jgi:4-hydroxy-3-polyprenylbenzoate decarboxylase
MKTGNDSFRGSLELLKQEGQLLVIDKEVNPVLEIAGIEKALDGGPAILFNNVNGYPHMRVAGNITATRENVCKLYGLKDTRKEMLIWGRNALLNPLPPVKVDTAPCQEVVITKDIDILETLPVITHSDKDPGPIFGSNIYLFTGNYFNGGTEISYKRTRPQGKDWCTLFATPGSHIRTILERHKGERIPVTASIGIPPSAILVAGTGIMPQRMGFGSDELGIAGALQGKPIEIVKAKTVDAYAIAQSEIVIEGYIHASREYWETKEAEELSKGREARFFPEWPKYFGRARKVYKFEVTGITHRADRPIFYTPLADSFEADVQYALLRESYLYDMIENVIPGLVQDIYQSYPAYITDRIQIKKRGKFDDGWERNIIEMTFAAFPGTRLVVVLDDDIDIRNADEVIWAISTRAVMETDLVLGAGGKGVGMMPIEVTDKKQGKIVPLLNNTRGLGIDATIPYELRSTFERSSYPSFQIDLKKWLSDEEIARIRSIQTDYAKVLAKIGG